MELYKIQLREGRWFLHEHPAGASSWGLEEVRKMEKEEGVTIRVADQCMYGLKTLSKDKIIRDKAVGKRTKFMTNSQGLAIELSQRCNASHQHQELVSGRAKGAARYLEELCEATCRGLTR